MNFKKALAYIKKKKLKYTIPIVDTNLAISVCRNIKLILSLDPQKDHIM